MNRVMIDLSTKRLDHAWEQYKKRNCLVFGDEKEELNAYNIFLSGIQWAYDDLRNILKAVEKNKGRELLN